MADFELVRREKYRCLGTEILFQRLSDKRGRPYVFCVRTPGRRRAVRIIVDCPTHVGAPRVRYLPILHRIAAAAHVFKYKTVVWRVGWSENNGIYNLADFKFFEAPWLIGGQVPRQVLSLFSSYEEENEEYCG